MSAAPVDSASADFVAVAALDFEWVAAAIVASDWLAVAGHYNRPDSLNAHCNTHDGL